MTILLEPGKPLTLTQNTIYTLPESIVHLTSDNPLEFSNTTTNSTTATTFQANAASTTGMFTSSLFCRCTSAAATVSVKKF